MLIYLKYNNSAITAPIISLIVMYKCSSPIFLKTNDNPPKAYNNKNGFGIL